MIVTHSGTSISVIRSSIPRHVAIIMDGNRRWARMRGLSAGEGHATAGVSALSVVERAVRLKVQNLTFFAFSTENWDRSPDEVSLLMQPWRWLITREQLQQYRHLGVRVRFIGDANDSRVPKRTLQYIREVESTCSSESANSLVTFAFNFGGRSDILAAVNSLIRSGHKDIVTESTLRSHMWSDALPDVDLVIRTSGELRLSNFLLWQCYYSELIMTDTLWPDFRGAHLEAAIEEFGHRRRRRGADAYQLEQGITSTELQ